MRFLALATDYDGTLATDGVVSESTIHALWRLRQSGRRLILVTGRELADLELAFPRLDLFDHVVAENGAVLYRPASKEKRVLAERPPDEFIAALRQRVPDLRAGDAITALWRPHEHDAIQAIHDSGLELQVIFNKDAVMILPTGVNKMTGLSAALSEINISRHNVVAVGDAENDHAFLARCECAVTVANAIPALKERSDLMMSGARGAGVEELIGRLLSNDLSDVSLDRHRVALARDVEIAPYNSRVLVCGHSGGGKTTLITGFLERLAEKGYQICLIDPEGDYGEQDGFVTTGDSQHAPSLDHLEKLLDDPDKQIAVNLVGVAMQDRPGILGRAISLIRECRLRTGRPHWLIVEEAHQMLPADWGPVTAELAGDSGSLAMITVHPEHVSSEALKTVNTLATVGKDQPRLFGEFCRATEREVPLLPAENLAQGEALVWFVDAGQTVVKAQVEAPRHEHDRHKKKYAEGRLEEERMFYFRGPENKLHLRVHNLTTFVQIAAGLDDETWFFHLRQEDYSRWFRNAIKDVEVADRIAAVEHDSSLSASESRIQITRIIEEKYTAAP